MKNFSSTLKNIDLFKAKKGLNMSRWNPTYKKNVTFDQMGSKVGGFFTIIYLVSLIAYFSYLV